MPIALPLWALAIGGALAAGSGFALRHWMGGGGGLNTTLFLLLGVILLFVFLMR